MLIPNKNVILNKYDAIITNCNGCTLFVLLGDQIINTTTCIVTRHGAHQYWSVGFDLNDKKSQLKAEEHFSLNW